MDNDELIRRLGVLSKGQPAPLKREIEAVTHKVRFPMKDILAKVPGDNLAARARKLKVSRQTMYVWLSEKFRPTVPQAIQIWRMTGVPVEHIVDDGFEATYVAEQQAGKKAARVATGRAKDRERAERTARSG